MKQDSDTENNAPPNSEKQGDVQPNLLDTTQPGANVENNIPQNPPAQTWRERVESLQDVLKQSFANAFESVKNNTKAAATPAKTFSFTPTTFYKKLDESARNEQLTSYSDNNIPDNIQFTGIHPDTQILEGVVGDTVHEIFYPKIQEMSKDAQTEFWYFFTQGFMAQDPQEFKCSDVKTIEKGEKSIEEDLTIYYLKFSSNKDQFIMTYANQQQRDNDLIKFYSQKLEKWQKLMKALYDEVVKDNPNNPSDAVQRVQALKIKMDNKETHIFELLKNPYEFRMKILKTKETLQQNSHSTSQQQKTIKALDELDKWLEVMHNYAIEFENESSSSYLSYIKNRGWKILGLVLLATGVAGGLYCAVLEIASSEVLTYLSSGGELFMDGMDAFIQWYNSLLANNPEFLLIAGIVAFSVLAGAGIFGLAALIKKELSAEQQREKEAIEQDVKSSFDNPQALEDAKSLFSQASYIALLFGALSDNVEKVKNGNQENLQGLFNALHLLGQEYSSIEATVNKDNSPEIT